MAEHAFHILTEAGDRLQIEWEQLFLASEGGIRLQTEADGVDDNRLIPEQDGPLPNDGHLILESFGEAPVVAGIFRPLFRPRRR